MDLFNHPAAQEDQPPVEGTDSQLTAEAQATETTEERDQRIADSDLSEGCAYCNNTGLEPGVALTEAKACPECGGSPFGVTE